jgi:hypothetical protein
MPNVTRGIDLFKENAEISFNADKIIIFIHKLSNVFLLPSWSTNSTIVTKKLSKPALALIGCLLIVIIVLGSFAIVSFENTNGRNSQTFQKNSIGLSIKPMGEIFKLFSNESKTFEATALNGTAPFTYIWKIIPSENFSIWINNEFQTLSTQGIAINGTKITLAYPQANEEFLVVTVLVNDANGVLGSQKFTVAISSISVYRLDSSNPGSDSNVTKTGSSTEIVNSIIQTFNASSPTPLYLIQANHDGAYEVIKGFNESVAFTSTNASKVFQYVNDDANLEGFSLYIAQGTYWFTNTVNFNKRFAIAGAGAGGNPDDYSGSGMTVLRMVSSSNCNLFNLTFTGTEVTNQLSFFKDIMFDGNRAAQSVVNTAIYQQANSAIDLRFEDLWFDSWKGPAVVIQQYWDHEFLRCVFEHNDDYGVNLLAINETAKASDVMFTDCFFLNTGGGISSSGTVASIWNVNVQSSEFTQLSNPAVNAEYAYYWTISNNKFYNMQNEALKVQGHYITVTSNTFALCSRASLGLYFDILINKTVNNGCSDIIISSNYIDAAGANGTIGIIGWQSLAHMSIVNNILSKGSNATVLNDNNGQIQGFIINGNTFYDGTGVLTGIRVLSAHPVTIANNIFDRYNTGIILTTGSKGALITGNTFENPSNIAISDTCSQGVGYYSHIYDNIGYNPIGNIPFPFFAGSTLILDSGGNNATMTSGLTYTNVGSPKTVYISGGAVTAISVNGQVIGITTGTITLEPTDSFSVSFTSSPTLKIFGQ